MCSSVHLFDVLCSAITGSEPKLSRLRCSADSKAWPPCLRLLHAETLVLVDRVVDHRPFAGRHAQARVAPLSIAVAAGSRKSLPRKQLALYAERRVKARRAD